MRTRVACAALAVFVLVSLTFGQQQTQSKDGKKTPAKSSAAHKSSAVHKKTAEKKTAGNPVERGLAKGGKATVTGAKYTGQAVADGSKEVGRGVVKGAKWVAHPWGKKEKKAKTASRHRSKSKKQTTLASNSSPQHR